MVPVIEEFVYGIIFKNKVKIMKKLLKKWTFESSISFAGYGSGSNWQFDTYVSARIQIRNTAFSTY